MQITSLSGLYQANFLENTEWTERRDKTSSAGRGKADTVSLSEESLSLAAALAARKGKAEESGTDSESSAGNDAGNGIFGRSGAAVCVNGKLSTEEELHAEIQRVEKEVKELGEQMADIMDGPFSEEEKARLSKPVHKRLQERMMDLQGLKAQAKAMQEMKTA